MFIQVNQAIWVLVQVKTVVLLPVFSSDLQGISCAIVNLQKGRSDNSVSVASPMIKSAIWRGRRRRLRQLELHTSTSWGIFPIYKARFPNLRSYFRNKICFSLLRIILLRNKG